MHFIWEYIKLLENLISSQYSLNKLEYWAIGIIAYMLCAQQNKAWPFPETDEQYKSRRLEEQNT